MRTSDEIDLAIDGPGYFVVEDEDGSRYCTRQGLFEVDAMRNLVTSDGLLALYAENLPITFGAGAPDISVSSVGTISSKNDPIGSIRIIQFE